MCQVGSETNKQTKPNKPQTTTTPTKKKQPTNQNKNTIKNHKNQPTNQKHEKAQNCLPSKDNTWQEIFDILSGDI